VSARVRLTAGPGQPYRGPLPSSAIDILRSLGDGEWHEVGFWNPKTLRRLEASEFIHVGGDPDTGRLIAVATDAGLARISPRVLPAIGEVPMTHPMVRP